MAKNKIFRGKMFLPKEEVKFETKVPYSLIKIYWWDHWRSHGAWNPPSLTDGSGPALCVDVGWLYKEDKNGYTLVRSLAVPDKGTEEASFGHVKYVLKNAMHKIEWLIR